MYLNEMIKKTLFNFHNKSLKSEVLLNIHTNSLEKFFLKKNHQNILENVLKNVAQISQ